MTFRHTLETAEFPGDLRKRPREGFEEICGILGVDEDSTPMELAESSIEACSADAFSVTITLSLFNT
jgi:hypothetical protein